MEINIKDEIKRFRKAHPTTVEECLDLIRQINSRKKIVAGIVNYIAYGSKGYKDTLKQYKDLNKQLERINNVRIELSKETS